VSDIIDEINEVHRAVGHADLQGQAARTVLLRRRYPSPPADVWDAVTDPERIARWFLPVSGEFKVGGHYQFEGNAGGTILACDATERLRVTWVMGDGPPSEVEVRLSPDGDGTVFELEHVAVPPPGFWEQFGPGAVGVGWDGAVMSLAFHLRGETIESPADFMQSPEARLLYTRSSEVWGEADVAGGEDPTTATERAVRTKGFYTGEAPPEGAGD
jgi:uncharacterized protein YndB with AHSA1/START domain